MKKELKEVKDKLEIIERYILLMLGVVDKPIPSMVHLQKEMFILSNFNPKIKEFITFLPHYEGPYSPELHALVKNPIYFESAWRIENEKIVITNIGKKLFHELSEMFKENERFRRLINAMKLIREIYDKLSKDELLLIIYFTYPEYIKKSNVFEEIFKKRKELASSLLKKGIISQDKYLELVRWKPYEKSSGR